MISAIKYHGCLSKRNFFIMPIDYSKYPDNWFTEIRPSILKRASNKCENCGVPNYAVGHRNEDGNFVPIAGNITADLAGEGLSYPSLNPIEYKEAREIADNETFCCVYGFKYIVIVLTIAHLNHNVEDNSPENLAALCQKCHNVHDIEFRKRNRKLNKGQLSLF